MQINCDLGEGAGNDAAIMPLVDVANIACGGHAGSVTLMAQTVALAYQYGKTIAAHPGFPDKSNFGRQDYPLRGEALTMELLAQVGALQGIAAGYGQRLCYIKPHGALYHLMMQQTEVLMALLDVASALQLPLMIQALPARANHHQQQLAQDYAVDLLFEAFVDRGYQTSGTLLPRQHPQALLTVDDALAQYQQLQHGQIIAQGKVLALQVDSVCVHGDHPQALPLLQQLRAAIKLPTANAD